MSLNFNSKFGLSRLGGTGAAPLDPAADIARLLNQHTHHWMALEKEIKDLKSKKEGAQEAYAAAVGGREAARVRLVEAEAALARVQAEATHCRAELEASQAANARLLEEVGAVKTEVAGVNSVADQARQEFTDQVAELMATLKHLRAAHPESFISAAPAGAMAAAAAAAAQ